MNNRNKNLLYANQHNIRIDKRIVSQEVVRGVYGIFEQGICLYTGRSNNLYHRILKSDGHISKIRYRQHVGKVMSAVDNQRALDIVLLQEVKKLNDHPAKDAQRLVSAESRWIDYFQAQDQCLEQFPEGQWA